MHIFIPYLVDVDPDDSSDNRPTHMAIEPVTFQALPAVQTRCVITRAQDSIDRSHQADLTFSSVHLLFLCRLFLWWLFHCLILTVLSFYTVTF